MLITTGQGLDGYRISGYLGVVSKQMLVGTQDTDHDTVAPDAESLLRSLDEARLTVLAKLEQEAEALGANGIVGLAVTYNKYGRYHIGVVASGTAVAAEPLEPTAEDRVLPVRNFDLKSRLRPCLLILRERPGGVFGKLKLKAYGRIDQLETLQLSAGLYSPFDEFSLVEKSVWDIADRDGDVYETAFHPLRVPQNILQNSRYAVVHLHALVSGGKAAGCETQQYMSDLSAGQLAQAKAAWGIDAVRLPDVSATPWYCFCGSRNSGAGCELCGFARPRAGFNLARFIEQAEGLPRASTMLAALKKLETDDALYRQTLDKLQQITDFERVHGNMQRDALQALRTLQGGRP